MIVGSSRGKKGQTLILFALTFVVLIGFASLAIDGSHIYLSHRQDQNAADAGALAGTGVMAKVATPISGPPATDSDPSVKAVHDIIAANGFNTVYPSTCSSTGATFTASWLDTGAACTARTGFGVKVTVTIPPTNRVGPCIQNPYNCIQVDLTQRINNYLMGSLGTPVTTSTVTATAFAKQVVPGNAFTGVPPSAVWLYEPANAACAAGAPQCFNRNVTPSKTLMTCGVGTCPTLWAGPGSNPKFVGVDGANAISTGADTVALYANGDAVIQAPTSICDPFKAAACPNANPLGYGFDSASQVFCTTETSPVPLGCTTAKPGGATLSTLTGNQVGPQAQFSFIPKVTAPATVCGGLVLNGEAITSANFPSLPAACVPPKEDPYTILPGQYTYIVINHGQYAFESGLFDITGVAPVTQQTTLSATATDGIDHSSESAATDWDLCATGTAYVPNNPASNCQALTAGVWIGQGRMAFAAASPGNSSQCALGQPQSGTQGGGGGPTIVSGSGVSFRLRDPNAGFVSTGEVQTVSLSGPAPGALAEINGAPTLIDMESPTATIHLDAVGTSSIGGATIASGYTGMIFQTQSAVGGGVELDPSLSGVATRPAVTGQIVAYSLTTFGSPGTAVDFSAGYGSGQPVVVSTARLESAIISTNLTSGVKPYTIKDNGDGTETFAINYGDEYALDAYDTYIKINGGNAIFFSKALWDPVPKANAPLPPNDVPRNNPDDNKPARPDDLNIPPAATPGGPTYSFLPQLPAPGQPYIAHDWWYTSTDPSLATSNDRQGRYKFETKGYWTWGHETLVPNQRLTDQSNPASSSLTFPKPPGATIQVQGYVTDGDRCGDYATFDYTLTQPNGPGGGSVPVPGGQQLMQ